jgi:hypothetical protein
MCLIKARQILNYVCCNDEISLNTEDGKLILITDKRLKINENFMKCLIENKPDIINVLKNRIFEGWDCKLGSNVH